MTTAFLAFSAANRRSVRPWSQAGRDAAVDKERVPVDERRCISGQKHRSADQLVDIAPARSWRPLFEPCREGGIINQRLVQRCLEIAGAIALTCRPCFAQSVHMPRVRLRIAPFVAV